MWSFLKESDSITNLERTRNLAIIGGAISGVTVIWTVLYSQFSGAFSGWSVGVVIAGLLATVLTGLVVFIIDYGTKVDLPYALDLLLSGRAFKNFRKNWRVFLFAFILLSFCFARLIFTAAIDWYGREEMVDAVMTKPKTKDIVEIRGNLSKATVATVATVESEIRQLSKDIKSVEKQVESENPEMISRIKSKKDKWGWNAKELRRRKEKATKELRERLVAKEQIRDTRLLAESVTADRIVAFEQGQNEADNKHYLETKDVLSKGAGYFGVGCSIAVLVVSLLLSLINSANQDNPEYYKKHEAKKTVEKPSTPVASPTTTSSTVSTTPAATPGSYPNMQLIKSDNEQVVEKLLYSVNALSSRIDEIRSRPVEVVERIIEKPSAVAPKTPEPLSDNGDKKQTVERTVDQSVEVVGVDTKNLRDATMKQWERSFTSKSEVTRLENKDKATKGIKRLEELGFKVEINGAKLSITSK